jgi:transposase
LQDLARRYRVLTLVLLGAISVAEASRRLSLSYRQTWTLYNRFRASGGSLDSLRFQREHAAPNRTPDRVRQLVLQMHERFPDAGHTAVAELLRQEADVQLSAQTVRRIRLDAPTPARAAAGTRMGKIPMHDARLLRLERLWVPTAGKRHVFQMIEDDVSGRPLVAWMFEHGTALDTLMMVRWLLEEQGAPHVLYVADSTSFQLLRDDYEREVDYRHENLGLRAQIHQMLLELGTRVEMPRAVENVRLDHWAPFTRDARRASSLAEANLILQRHVEMLSHGRYATSSPTPARVQQGRFAPLPEGYQLDDVFCVYLRRRVGDDGCFHVDGVPYRVTRGLGYRGWAGIELGVRVIPSRSVAAFYQGELIEEFALDTPRPADLSQFRRLASAKG